jgi:hypothetical protein
MNTLQRATGTTDFDFFIGCWNVHHRRLKERLANCTDWEEFGGTSTVIPLLGGQGNVDDNLLHLPAGTYRAVTLRTFDPATQQWSIWWLDGRMPGHLDPPMRGRFAHGVGTFYADDVYKDIPIKVRFLWDARDPQRPTWAQAFSTDGGLQWETNWLMTFTKVSQP